MKCCSKRQSVFVVQLVLFFTVSSLFVDENALGMFDYDSIYLTDMAMTKAQRSLFRESVPNHAMVFIGVDMQNDKPAKWLVENSWGDDKGSKGLWTIYDSWFETNVYSIIVKKKYVPRDILDIYKQPAIKLPPWDPIYSFVQ